MRLPVPAAALRHRLHRLCDSHFCLSPGLLVQRDAGGSGVLPSTETWTGSATLSVPQMVCSRSPRCLSRFVLLDQPEAGPTLQDRSGFPLIGSRNER